ncbi:SDR family oxidoreductase [Providencia alcalifaciens]|uniref:SDR family oxidoreductase n=1 Tax=Providencia alcalifaciens TaxID=126385 RepID=UPI000D3BF26D|nr:SDR family oxidoreductase [Providencia alcalifaciens]MBG5883990.1 SDR family oxidoreductase [Providencia alcalifaciens]
MNKFTIIGGYGFIGSEIVNFLKEKNAHIFIPQKDDDKLFRDELGTIIYCAGYGDCINDPFKVLESNTILLSRILKKSNFDKLIYISSTRIYMENNSSDESSNFIIDRNDSRKLFNLTKLVSEELCLLSNRNVIIVRPSNVYGLAISSPLFLPSIVRDAILKSEVNMYVSPTYEKDYIYVKDVADAIYKLAIIENPKNKIYNLASGENTNAQQIANVLSTETGCKVFWHEQDKMDDNFPVTNIESIKVEINFDPKSVLVMMKQMIKDYLVHYRKDKKNEE